MSGQVPGETGDVLVINILEGFCVQKQKVFGLRQFEVGLVLEVEKKWEPSLARPPWSH